MFNATSKPKIRTRTVQVPVKKTAPAPAGTTNGAARSSSSGAHNAGPPVNRYALTTNKVRTAAVPAQRAERDAPARARMQKRKVAATRAPDTPQWASSDDSSSDEDSDRLGAGLRKRQKTSSSIEPTSMNRCLEPDLKRRIRIPDPDLSEQAPPVEAPAPEEGSVKAKLIDGLEMTRGKWAKDFQPAFPGSPKNPVVKLQYPSRTPPESFEAVTPRDNSNFNPLEDIYFSIEEILQNYLPPDLSADLLSETDGTVRLLKRAVNKNNPADFTDALTAFNKFIKDRLRDGTIAKVLDSTHAIPLSLTKRILAQVYQRTVSPHAHLLRRVKDKETTYGELLPPFVHTIFHQTHLNSSSVFVDLGSGVGNVVLQSALQTGAESWGIEIMSTPADFAVAQASELRARAKRWNIALGAMHLLHGSFLDSPVIDAVLRRADVVLVNNKVFDNETNTNLLAKFLDLKDGCKVVSLESFGGGGGKQGIRHEQDIANLFDEERFDSGTTSVSWAGESVEYFIATKER